MKKLTTWDKVMSLKKNDTRHVGITNGLINNEIETILATVDYWGGNIRQTFFDLTRAQYRIFDWLAMLVMANRIESIPAVKVLAYSFLKVDGDIDKWIADLRETDYEMDRKWEKLNLEK